MAKYLYQTNIYTNTDSVTGLNVSQNNTDLADYVNNHRTNTEKISEVIVAETTFTTVISYEAFDNQIASPLTWSDVKEATYPNHYALFLLTDNPL